MTEQSLEEVAHHEAGHAVASYALGRFDSVYRVTIVPTNDYLGIVDGSFDDDGTQACVEDHITGLYAGFAAQVRFDHVSEERARAGASDDDAKADDLMRFLPREGADESVFRDRAASLVEQHWPKIEALARQLLVHRTLDQSECEFIFEAANGDESALTALSSYRRLKGSASRRDGTQRPPAGMSS